MAESGGDQGKDIEEDADAVNVENEELNSIASDGESHHLRFPFTEGIHFATFGIILRIILWTVLFLVQVFTLGWIVLIAMFFSEEVSFFTYYMSPAFGSCGSVEIMLNTILTALSVIQLRQKYEYRILHKARILFNITVAFFLSHLCVFFPLSLLTMKQIKTHMESDMRRELNRLRNTTGRAGYQYDANYPLHKLWNLTQEKYSCCGFGKGEEDYVNFPTSCCPKGVKCDATTIFRKNCLAVDGDMAKFYVDFGNILLGVIFPFAILLYYGFRYFRPYWVAEQRVSETSLDSIESMDDEEEDAVQLNPPPPPSPKSIHRKKRKLKPHPSRRSYVFPSTEILNNELHPS